MQVAYEIEEANQSCKYNTAVLDKARRNNRASGKPKVVNGEHDEDNEADDDHCDN